MKFLQLVDSLTNKEVREFELVIKNKKKTGFQKILSYAKKLHKSSGKEYEVEVLFKSVFGEKHSKDKDYLLRNELRLFNKELENFIASKELSEQEKSKLVLQRLLDQKQGQLFEKEWKKLHKTAESEHDYKLLFELNRMFFSYLVNMQIVKENILHQQEETVSELFTNLNKFYVQNYWKSKVYDSFVQNYLQKMGEKSEKQSIFFELSTDFEAFEDDFVRFTKFKLKSYASQNIEKIESAKQALSLIDKVQHSDFQRNTEFVVLKSNLAVEYMLIRKYIKAAEHLSEILESNIETPALQLAGIVFNYLNVSLKLGDYETALNLVEKHEQLLLDSPILGGKSNLNIAMAYVFSKQTEKAEAILPENLKFGARDDYFYYRLVLSIIFYKKQEFELCERENTNIIQSIDNEKRFESYKLAAQYFNRTLNHLNSKEELDKIQQLLISQIQNTKIRHNDILPIYWLNQTVNNLLKK